MDDDISAGVMQMPGGGLYLSTAAEAGQAQTETTIRDCDGVCRTLFGSALLSHSGSNGGLESWKTDRPMRKEGFNIGASRGQQGWVMVENSGHGGAGVAASWACAARAVDALVAQLPQRRSW